MTERGASAPGQPELSTVDDAELLGFELAFPAVPGLEQGARKWPIRCSSSEQVLPVCASLGALAGRTTPGAPPQHSQWPAPLFDWKIPQGTGGLSWLHNGLLVTLQLRRSETAFFKYSLFRLTLPYASTFSWWRHLCSTPLAASCPLAECFSDQGRLHSEKKPERVKAGLLVYASAHPPPQGRNGPNCLNT